MTTASDIVTELDRLYAASVARLQAVALDMHVGPRLHPSGRVGQKHDVRLEPLRLVQIHQPDDVRTSGLE